MAVFSAYPFRRTTAPRGLEPVPFVYWFFDYPDNPNWEFEHAEKLFLDEEVSVELLTA